MRATAPVGQRCATHPMALRGLFDRIGTVMGRRGGGPEQLRRNLARVIGTTPQDVPDDLIVDAMTSYMRYWCEAFRLPSMDPGPTAATMDLPAPDPAAAGRGARTGQGVVLARRTRATGTWRACGWSRTTGPSPPSPNGSSRVLFRRFVDYRESLGFEIFPLVGREQPPFGELAKRLRAGGIVCLLGERDLARHGVPVTFFGEPTRMPAGPAKLAIETGAALIPVHHWFDEEPYSTASCGEPIDVSGGVDAATRHWPRCSSRTSPHTPPTGTCCNRCGRRTGVRSAARLEADQ